MVPKYPNKKKHVDFDSAFENLWINRRIKSSLRSIILLFVFFLLLYEFHKSWTLLRLSTDSVTTKEVIKKWQLSFKAIAGNQ